MRPDVYPRMGPSSEASSSQLAPAERKPKLGVIFFPAKGSCKRKSHRYCLSNPEDDENRIEHGAGLDPVDRIILQASEHIEPAVRIEPVKIKAQSSEHA